MKEEECVNEDPNINNTVEENIEAPDAIKNLDDNIQTVDSHDPIQDENITQTTPSDQEEITIGTHIIEPEIMNPTPENPSSEYIILPKPQNEMEVEIEALPSDDNP